MFKDTLKMVTLPAEINDPEIWARIAKYHLIYSLSGLLVGLAIVAGGVYLCINGIAGSTQWSARILGLKSEINDAAPGVIISIVGLFVIFLTRFGVKSRFRLRFWK